MRSRSIIPQEIGGLNTKYLNYSELQTIKFNKDGLLIFPMESRYNLY